MKTKKAISWEKISEGIITAGEIQTIEEHKLPIVLSLVNITPNQPTHNIIITPKKYGKKYLVINGNVLLKKEYKYLSCAVRRAVREYKAALRTNKWRMVGKA